MLRQLSLLADLSPFRALSGGTANRPIHFSGRSRRLLNWSRFVTPLDQD